MSHLSHVKFRHWNHVSNRSVWPAVWLLTAIGLGSYASLDAQTVTKPGSDRRTAAAEDHGESETEPSPTEFLRVKRDAAGRPVALQTAITRYRPQEGELVIDLVGAVHIGEVDYYRQLNDQFELYEAVLYELVAPKGTRVPRGGKTESNRAGSPLDLVSWMQGQAKSSLGLQSQLERVDYQKSNFIHADLSPAEMNQKMSERGDTPLTIGLSALSEIIRQQNKTSQKNAARNAGNPTNKLLDSASLLEILGDPLKMKLMMADQFTRSGAMDMGLGATLNQLLIADRNEAAIKILQKQIAGGKTKLAIFYGAAHMPDFEKRLATEFGLKRSKQVWVNAWDLTQVANPPKSNSTTNGILRLLNELSK